MLGQDVVAEAKKKPVVIALEREKTVIQQQVKNDSQHKVEQIPEQAIPEQVIPEQVIPEQVIPEQEIPEVIPKLQVTEQPLQQTVKKPKTKKVERFIMPFTEWVEGKLHDSSLVNPTAKKAEGGDNNTEKNQLTLRQAIKKALQQYPGTVLSAEKHALEHKPEYKIKILSKDGVIRVVSVPGYRQLKSKTPDEIIID